MGKRIYIIRHGQTDLNKQGIVQGRGIDASLNLNGKKQAEAFFNAYKHLPFDKVYTSRLTRTVQTVQAFLDLGIPHDMHEGLDEISWGIYEGKPQSPDIIKGFNQLTSAWKSGQLDLAVEQGESPLALIERQKIAMEHILSQENEEMILICMHGRAMRILLAWLTGVDPSLMDTFPHTNTALYVLESTPEQVNMRIIDGYNINHLTDF